ncbi:CopG family transcriptional regulator [Candidatus Electrothrix aarhusensis]
MNPLKKTPDFKNEDEERAFWDNHDSTDFVDWSKAKRVTLSNLKPSVKKISLRLPQSMLDDLKLLANKRDVPYHTMSQFFYLDTFTPSLFQIKVT